MPSNPEIRRTAPRISMEATQTEFCEAIVPPRAVSGIQILITCHAAESREPAGTSTSSCGDISAGCGEFASNCSSKLAQRSPRAASRVAAPSRELTSSGILANLIDCVSESAVSRTCVLLLCRHAMLPCRQHVVSGTAPLVGTRPGPGRRNGHNRSRVVALQWAHQDWPVFSPRIERPWRWSAT